ncbi:MAG: S-methyl-5-thioribose-1-phosphate isomerase [Clostridia bacterium]|nr:S-methyl-5-thioribose-1-phosphate isomerase [Clostridia bacterium]
MIREDEMLEVVPLWFENDRLYILDQTRLPNEEVTEELVTKEDVWDAIKKLKVRGAPAIGVCAAYGLYIATKDFCPYPDSVCGDMNNSKRFGCHREENVRKFLAFIKETADYINSSRPTAVNLSWALKRMVKKVGDVVEAGEIITVKGMKNLLREEAIKIHQEDVAACMAMGEYGLELLKPGMGVLTHCNAGTIATSKYGTCLAPIHLGQERGYGFRMFCDETRPLLQGARLTSWELVKNGVDTTLICDNMASIVMKNGWIDAVVVGCDRMAANGDGANKIGTSGVAILAKEYGIPFYMFVPTSTIDLDTPTGADIPIELREGDEIRTMWYEKPMAPEGAKTYNPAFDVTDHKYITAVVTEKGIVRPPYDVNLRKIIEE